MKPEVLIVVSGGVVEDVRGEPAGHRESRSTTPTRKR